MNRLLGDGGSEQALVLFLRDIAGLTTDELDELRSAPLWQDMVDAAPALPRELRAIAGYEFEAARFADMTTPTLLLSGSESPPFYKDATEAVDSALPNSQVATFEGQEHVAMLTATNRFVDEVLAFIRESN
jgi:pimeloyl-ACP methyl ester carboxylesterase